MATIIFGIYGGVIEMRSQDETANEFENRIETKSEAIRILVEKGLKEHEKKSKK
jgi:hypothetical protein